MLDGNTGAWIWLVTREDTSGLTRAWPTEEEALAFANEYIVHFNRLVQVHAGEHLGGAVLRVKKVRLGPYEDGS